MSDNTVEIGNNNKLNLDLKMNVIGDTAEYKVVLKNYITIAIKLFDPLLTTLDIVCWNLYLTFSGIIDILDWIPS